MFSTSVNGTPPFQSHETEAVSPRILPHSHAPLSSPTLYDPLLSSINFPSKYVSIPLSSYQLHQSPSQLSLTWAPLIAFFIDPHAYTPVSPQSTLHGNLYKIKTSSPSNLKLLMVSHLSC